MMKTVLQNGLRIIFFVKFVCAISLVFFIPAGIAASKWEWLEKEIFDTEYGVHEAKSK